MVKGNFLTEDSYLGDIRNPLTLNRYSYCIGNPLFYDDPSGHDPTPVGVTDSDAVEAYTIRVIMEHQNEVNRVMDNVFNWFGDIPGLDNTSTANQVLNGFATGFVSSYYATWDAITSPEYICASLDYMLRHPVETVTGIAKNAISGSDIGGRIYQDIKAEDYRAAAQKVGYEVGKLSQVVLARAAIKKCGELWNEKKRETLPSPPINEGVTETLENITEPVAAGPSLVQAGEGYGLKEVATKIDPVEGYTDVVVHGTSDSFGVWHNG